MTSKRKQITKTPISIFFSENQIPEKYKKIKFEEYHSYSIYKSDERVLVNISKLANINILQKNFKLLLIGQAIKNKCDSGDFFVDYFGCKKANIKNFLLGWSLSNYSFERYKSKKKKKTMQRFLMIMKKK